MARGSCGGLSIFSRLLAFLWSLSEHRAFFNYIYFVGVNSCIESSGERCTSLFADCCNVFLELPDFRDQVIALLFLRLLDRNEFNSEVLTAVLSLIPKPILVGKITLKLISESLDVRLGIVSSLLTDNWDSKDCDIGVDSWPCGKFEVSKLSIGKVFVAHGIIDVLELLQRGKKVALLGVGGINAWLSCGRLGLERLAEDIAWNKDLLGKPGSESVAASELGVKFKGFISEFLRFVLSEVWNVCDMGGEWCILEE